MYQFDKLVEMVKSASPNPDAPNTCCVATMMYPPQLAWFPDNIFPPPANYYVNNLEKIDWLNEEILRLNQSNGIDNFLGLHTHGVRTGWRSCVDEFGRRYTWMAKYHRWNHWREENEAQKMHLTNKRRFRLGQAVNNYFPMNTT